MQRWEHLSLTLRHKGQIGWTARKPDGSLLSGVEVADYIKNLGYEGWEMVSAVSFEGDGNDPDQTLWFKRPLMTE